MRSRVGDGLNKYSYEPLSREKWGGLFAVLSACVLPACKTDLSDVWNSIVNISFEKSAQTASVAAKSSAEISGRTVADRTKARDSRSQMLFGFDIE